MNVLMYGLLAAGPTAAFWLAVHAIGWSTAGPARPPVTTGSPPAAGPVGTPGVQRLVDDLRRLEREYLRVERSDLPARAARLRALNLAYDDTLRACCHELGLPEPHERPLSGVVRLQIEAELAQHGLIW